MGAAATTAADELAPSGGPTDIARAIAGGLLFGVPLLYTMELWWSGQRAAPARTLAVLALTMVVAVVLQRTGGFRRTADTAWRDAVVDAVVVVGVSLVVVTGVLVVLREVTLQDPVGVSVSKVVHQALAFTIGAGVAGHHRHDSRDEPDPGPTPAAPGRGRSVNATLADLGATVLGAVFIALNVAPTDEIAMLHAQMDRLWTVVLLLGSLASTYLIVFVAGFAGQAQRHDQEGILQHPITETVVCYLVSLLCALAMLAVFDRLGGTWSEDLAAGVILALPASVGGAAGRLAT